MVGRPKLPPPWQKCIKGKKLGCLCSFHRKLEGVADGLSELTPPQGVAEGMPSRNVLPDLPHPQAPLPSEHLWTSFSVLQPGPEFPFAQKLV